MITQFNSAYKFARLYLHIGHGTFKQANIAVLLP